MLIHQHPFHPSSEALFLLNESDMEFDEALKISTETNANSSCSPDRMKGIASPHENDVLMGRGGKNNQHSGNEKLRALARERCENYRIACKKVKSDISRELVRLMRQLDPPSRFLRKNAETGRWEDVGDDIAREKASQVLRDAVSEKNGPMARPKRKPSTDYMPSGPFQTVSGVVRNDANHKVAHVDHMPGSSRRQAFPHSSPLISDIKPSAVTSSYSAPYHEYTSMYGQSTAAITPSRPPVTPASESVARKRQRVYDSPLSIYSYNYFSPHGNSYGPNQPSEIGHSSLGSRAYMAQSSTGYFSHPAALHFSASRQSSTPTTMNLQHHSLQRFSRRNEPWMADSQFQYSARRPSLAHTGDFDPYNEEILSDHSDHRDGSMSPFE